MRGILSERQAAMREKSTRKPKPKPKKRDRRKKIDKRKKSGNLWKEYGTANPDPPPSIEASIRNWGGKIKERA